MEKRQEKIVILGAGIIGITTAARLAEQGYDVELIDKSGICEETSRGNAGAFAFTDTLPMASKGIMRKVPKWLLDPLGPLSIRPAYLPQLTPWLYKFWRASASKRQMQIIEAQINMMRLAEKETMALVARANINNMLGTKGALEVYESESEFAAALPSWNIREQHGVEVQHLKASALAEFQPSLSKRFVAGSYIPAWRNVKDPQSFAQSIWNYAQKLGAKFTKNTVKTILPKTVGSMVVLENNQQIFASKLIIATGAWSKQFAAVFSDTIPLDTERGYNTTFPADSFDLNIQITFPSHGFVVAPLACGLRVGGAVEFGGLQLPPNYKRAKVMVEKAKKFLPGLKTENGKQWMGYRPSLPDSLPVIGRAKGRTDVFYCFGHGHLGLTQSAASACLILEMLAGAKSSISLQPFAPNRF